MSATAACGGCREHEKAPRSKCGDATASRRISGTARGYRPLMVSPKRQSETISYRDVAQFGSALRSGRRGRRFKSCHLDQNYRVGCCLPCNFYCVERCRASKMRQHFHRFCATDLSDVRSLGAKPVQHPVISTKKTAPTSVGAVFLSISRVGLRPQVPKVVRDEGTAPTVACSVFFIGDTF